MELDNLLDQRRNQEQRLYRLELLRDGFDQDIRVQREEIDLLLDEESPEQFDVAQQYNAALHTLDTFGYSGELTPAYENLQDACEQASEQIQSLRRPRLLLVPNVSFASMLRAIERARRSKKFTANDLYFNEQMYGVPREQWLKQLDDPNFQEDEFIFYYPYVVEGAKQAPLTADDQDQSLSKRIAKIKSTRPQGMQGMTRKIYAHLAMHHLAEGKPLDRRTWTIFDGDEAQKKMIPRASCTHGPTFACIGCDDVLTTARFRSVIPMVAL
ncbi:MAG TPA: hypothetical protein VI913_02150 [Candidatus Peribacteraceae bacterium]|nr:hypothetical protein [Candidatus Peribacteraceae bacterium]